MFEKFLKYFCKKLKAFSKPFLSKFEVEEVHFDVPPDEELQVMY